MSAAPLIPEPIVEYVDDTPEPAAPATVELRGETFTVRPQGVSLLALMKFATLAKRGLTTDNLEGLAGLYTLLRSCIADAEWDGFEDHATTVGAGGEELMAVVRDAVQAAAARPTQQPPGSPGGLSTTGQSSAAGSSSPASFVQGDRRVQAALEQQGRPDLALVVKRAREASTAS